MEHILSAFTKWCLRKNILAAKNENLPIIFVRDTAHCSWLEFELRASRKHYASDVAVLTISYKDTFNVEFTKSKIRNFIYAYIRVKQQAATPKLKQVTKACVDLIDNPDIYLDKKTNIVVKSIISKTRIIDYNNNTYDIDKLYLKYL